MEKQKHSEGMLESKDLASSKKIDVLLGAEKVSLTIQEIEAHQASELATVKTLTKKKKRSKEENTRMALAQNNLKALNKAHTLISKRISVTPSSATPVSQRTPVAASSESPSSKSKGSKVEFERKPLTEDEKRLEREKIAKSFDFLNFGGITDSNFRDDLDGVIDSHFPNPDVFSRLEEADNRRLELEADLRKALALHNQQLEEERITAAQEAAPSSVSIKSAETVKESKKVVLDSLSSDTQKLLGLNERKMNVLRSLPDDLKKDAEVVIADFKQRLETGEAELHKEEGVLNELFKKTTGITQRDRDFRDEIEHSIYAIKAKLQARRNELEDELLGLVDKNKAAVAATSKRKPEVEVPVEASEKSKSGESILELEEELDRQQTWRERRLNQIAEAVGMSETERNAAKDQILAEYDPIIGSLEAKVIKLRGSSSAEGVKTTPKSDTTPTSPVEAVSAPAVAVEADPFADWGDLGDEKSTRYVRPEPEYLPSATSPAEYNRIRTEIKQNYDSILESEEQFIEAALKKSGGVETPEIKQARTRVANLERERLSALKEVYENYAKVSSAPPSYEDQIEIIDPSKPVVDKKDVGHDPDSEVEIEIVPDTPQTKAKGVFESGSFDVQNNPRVDRADRHKNEKSIVVDVNLTEEFPFFDAELQVEPRTPWAQLELPNGNKFEYAAGDYITFNVGGTWEVGVVQDVEPKLSADGTQVELVVKEPRTHATKTILISEPARIFTPLRAKEFSINGVDYTAEDGHFTPNGEIEYRLVSARNEVLPFVSLETINNLLEIEEGKAEMMRNIENIEDRIHKLANEKVGELMRQLTELHLKSLDIGRKAGAAREWGAYDAEEIKGMKKKIEELRRMLQSSFADLEEEIDRQDKKFREYEKGELHAPIIDRIKREMRKKNLTPALRNSNESEYYRKLEEIFRGVIGDVPFGDLLYEEAEKRGVRGDTKGIEAIVEAWSKESRKPEIDVKKEQTALQDQLKPLRKKIEDLPLKDTEKDALLAEYKSAKDLCDAIQEGDKQAAIAILKALQAIGKLEVRVATLERPVQSNRESGKRRELVELPSSLIHELLAAHPAEMQRLVDLLYLTPPPVGTDRDDITDKSSEFKIDYSNLSKIDSEAELLPGRDKIKEYKAARDRRRALEFSTENTQITAALKDLFRTQPNTATTAALRLYGIRDWAEFKQLWDTSYAGNVGMALYDSLRNDIADRMKSEENQSITQTKKGFFPWSKEKTEHVRYETNAEKEKRIIAELRSGEKDAANPNHLSGESLDKFSAEFAIALRKVNLEARLNDPKVSDPRKPNQLSAQQEELLVDAGFGGPGNFGKFKGKNRGVASEVSYNNVARFVGGRWRIAEGVNEDVRITTNQSVGLNKDERKTFGRLDSTKGVETVGVTEASEGKQRLTDIINQTRNSLRLIREATERGRVVVDLRGSFDKLGDEIGKCYDILVGTSADQTLVELAGHSPFNKLLEDVVLEGRTFSKQFEALIVERKQLEATKKAQNLLDKVKIAEKEKKVGTKETPAKKKARETVERSFVKSKTARALVLAGLGLAGAGIYKGLNSSNGRADIAPEQPTASAPRSNSVRSSETRSNAPVAASRPEIVPSRTARVSSLRAGADSVRAAVDRVGSVVGLSESAPSETFFVTSEVFGLVESAFPNSDKSTLVSNLQKALTLPRSESNYEQVKAGWENLKLKPGDSAAARTSKSEFVKSNLGSILREIGEAPITSEQANALRVQIAAAASSQF